MKKSGRFAYFTAGAISAAALIVISLFAVPSLAATVKKTINVFTGVAIYVDDIRIEPKDANGNTVEPFLYDGTTYLPVRAVSEALGKPITWDGKTYSVYIGKHSAAKAAVEPAFKQPPAGIGIGQTAPNFTLDLRGGGSVSLWDLRGKPVLMNVCTTWCPPCQVEFPEIQAIHEAYGGRATILCVDLAETKSEVDRYFDRFDYTYPVAYDPDGVIDTDYNIEFIPQTWVIDANGVITDYIPGAATYDVFSASLDKVLK